ncbi:MAG TPA: LytR C-terminal domain-containing protein [Actinomycetota bacterium]|nr:LytR C-terminal domain-containing protein [Actinomycetota bacterium]
MGRHSAGEQGPFYRSVLGWFLPWLLIAAVVGVAVWVLVNMVGGDETKPTAVDSSPSATPTPRETETEIAIASPSPTQSEPEDEETPTPKPVKLITEGINVQVLNGTSDAGADDALADRLTGLGFTIEAIDDSSVQYPRTTVFWSYPEAQEAAEALAARFDWVAEPKPGNLSDTVALHVVVGQDEV